MWTAADLGSSLIARSDRIAALGVRRWLEGTRKSSADVADVPAREPAQEEESREGKRVFRWKGNDERSRELIPPRFVPATISSRRAMAAWIGSAGNRIFKPPPQMSQGKPPSLSPGEDSPFAWRQAC